MILPSYPTIVRFSLQCVGSGSPQLTANIIQTTILGGNLGSTETAKQPISSKKSKHIEIRFLKVREYQPEAQNRLRVRHIDGDANTADMFTKILPDPLFKSYLKTIGMRISKEQWDATCDPSAKPSAKKRSLREL